MEDRHYYRPNEIAQRFQVSLSYVYFLIRSKKIKAVKIGRLHRIPKKEYCRLCKGTNGCEPCTFKVAHK
jgi:excisionase family DNA binding protein